ncbi:MAG: hypothetical protein WCW67_07640 [Candidatus Margulisiibacteriota bacterium]|jgi:hypothetical protein
MGFDKQIKIFITQNEASCLINHALKVNAYNCCRGVDESNLKSIYNKISGQGEYEFNSLELIIMRIILNCYDAYCNDEMSANRETGGEYPVKELKSTAKSLNDKIKQLLG